MARILVVEDDRSIREGLCALLEADGYEVLGCARQDDALRALNAGGIDLALVDIALEQGNGFAVCAAAKAPGCPSRASVIFLTASDDEYSCVAGLDMGADDYIAKPFRPRELSSRIRSVLRRASADKQTLALGDVVVDVASASVRKAGVSVALSALEYRLLLVFAQAPGKLVTREALAEVVWENAGEYVSDNTLNVYIKRLREKIEDDPAKPRIIETVRGLGYRAQG